MPWKYKSDEFAWRARLRESGYSYIEKLKSVPCLDCGINYPHYSMEFDHVPERGTKKHDITSLAVRCKPTAKVLVHELAKCDVVCRNCHGARTYSRRVGAGKLTNL